MIRCDLKGMRTMVQCPHCKGAAKELEITEVAILDDSTNVDITCLCEDKKCGYEFDIRRTYASKFLGIEYITGNK